MLIIVLLIIGLSKLIESSRLENKDYKPKLQANTVWKCTNPNIEFKVKNLRCFGQMELDAKTINVEVIFDRGASRFVTVYNINSNQLYQKNYKATLVFNGDCKFYESKCIVKVTESNVDGIKVGDKITFVKQES
mgnify:CR=1 FL=1